MKVFQTEQVQSQVVLSIEVEPPELEEHLDRVYKRVVQSANIPGFRKGKAPRSVVERFLGRDALLDEAMESLLPQMTSKAIEEGELDVVAPPRVLVTQQEPLTIEATVALRPAVDLGEYHKTRLESEAVEVSQEEVDQLLEHLRQETGTWEPVERPVELGDLVTMEVRGEVDGESLVDDKGVDYILTADSQSPLPGFADKLVGFSRGEEHEFALAFPADHVQVDMAGKECQFTVVVEEVKERKLPEPDDEFAQSLNMEVETLAELRVKLEEDLRKQNQRAADHRYEEQAILALVDGAQVELPPLLVEEEVEHILSDQAEALRRQQVSMETYLSTVGKSVEEIQEEVRPAAVDRLTRTLTLQALREKEGIEVSPEEVEEELESMARESGSGDDTLRQILGTEDGKASIRNMLLNRKTLGLLAGIARGEVVEAASVSEEASPQDDEEEESEKGAQNG